jgi:hypothetical protein
MRSRSAWFAAILMLLPGCDGTGPPLDDEPPPLTEVDVAGIVRSVGARIGVAGVTVELRHGYGDVASGILSFGDPIASATTDSTGQFSLSAAVKCDGGLTIRAVPPADYFSIYPGTQNVASVVCTSARQERTVYLTPRSVEIRFDAEGESIPVNDSLTLTVVLVASDGSESTWRMHMFWGIQGVDTGGCGWFGSHGFPTHYGANPMYYAPAAVPGEGECGGAAGEVGITLRVLDDIKGVQPGANGSSFLTIVPGQ